MQVCDGILNIEKKNLMYFKEKRMYQVVLSYLDFRLQGRCGFNTGWSLSRLRLVPREQM